MDTLWSYKQFTKKHFFILNWRGAGESFLTQWRFIFSYFTEKISACFQWQTSQWEERQCPGTFGDGEGQEVA